MYKNTCSNILLLVCVETDIYLQISSQSPQICTHPGPPNWPGSPGPGPLIFESEPSLRKEKCKEISQVIHVHICLIHCIVIYCI
jgi:hypothetical protein